VHGDGTTTWVLTHHKDFAKVCRLLGIRGHGDTFIYFRRSVTWNQIIERSPPRRTGRIGASASEFIAGIMKMGRGLLGDKATPSSSTTQNQARCPASAQHPVSLARAKSSHVRRDPARGLLTRKGTAH